MIKPGWRTSEYWFTVASFVFSGLYLFGLIDTVQNKDDMIQETSKGLEALILIIGQLTVLFRYVKGRSELKKLWWSTATPLERKEANRKNEVRRKRKKKTPTTKTTIKKEG